MKKFIIIIIIFLSTGSTNTFANELIEQIKNESKNVFKTLTKKSLKKEKLKIFILNYVIIIDDKRGDGFVTYFFDDLTYRRYKDLNLLSEDKWIISRTGKLKLFFNNNKETWKIQPGKNNTINIKKELTSIGKLYKFSYKDKTNFHIDLEEKKINLAK